MKKSIISSDLSHDQVFVDKVIKEMLDHSNRRLFSIIITSDNFYVQYKSSHSFYHLQKLSNKLNIQIIRVYGIPGHGKNEVDCCSGVAKIAIRNKVSKGKFFSSAEDCTNFLSNKFANFIDPKYMFKVINSEELIVLRKDDQKFNSNQLKGCLNLEW